MPMTQSGTESRADRAVNADALGAMHQQLDATIRPILDGFMQANDLQRQYTVSTSSTRPVWWLANPHTGWTESPLRVQLVFDASERTTEPVLAVHIQGVAEWVPQNVHTLGHVLHRETTYHVRLQSSRGTTEVWPQGTTRGLHGRHSAEVK